MTKTMASTTDQAWKGVALLTFLGTTAILGVSVGLNYLLLFSEALTPFGRSMITAILLPVVLGVPLFLFVGLKQIELRRYRRELDKSATFDTTTGCLNGAVFTSMVEKRTARPSVPGPKSGAFLVIHSEHLRSINLRFGLEWGDQALRLIASTIQSSVRAEDLVGRMGTSMFGVFLAGATEAEAREIGQRIEARIAQVYFAPKGTEDALTVKVGGVVFENQVEFADMFRSAEQRMAGVQDGAAFELTHLHS
ncbi:MULTISPECIES: GGDEF domain-containing protein [unclassified Mesorhizobium]|uniref:GGDEF domain-containing protein n=1 Tax=unclassified Mesorhizobium TaxID=325217 RepID=UPI000FD338BF|nr:GGDEF domain-containing protein [Mesorhizobium sp. M7A.F.Ca.US.010.02.1.1]RUW88063.1 GGDEF domain-containing protein [Mesorhizobium sp. M7A.F.Ca.US.010.02.1.1]